MSASDRALPRKEGRSAPTCAFGTPRKDLGAAIPGTGAMEHLSSLLAILVAYFDPDVILLGNQDPRFYEVVVPLLEKHLQQRLQGNYQDTVEMQIVPAAQNSALRGVAGLVIDTACLSSFER